MSAVELRVLGPLEAARDGAPVALGGPKPRVLLALLLLEAGRTVSSGRLIDDLWGAQPPATAAKTLQKYVSLLRAALAERDILVTRSDGYALLIPPERVDASRFEGLVDEAAEAGDPARSVALLEQALGLWRGVPFAELDDLPAAVAERRRLEERRLEAIEAFADAELALGHHARLVGRLEELVTAHPLRERLWGQLMLALYRCGRQADALDAYQRLRATLAEQLGIDPSVPLRRLEESILRQDPDLDPPAVPGAGPVQTPPSNLPAQLSSFVGRETELADLKALLADRRLVTLIGPAGSGKTRLALEHASRVRVRYRDGAWLVELAALTAPGQVPAAVASTLGLADQPGRTTAQVVGDYLAESNTLLVVDNCEHVVGETAWLVSELLRAGDGLRVLATSREPLGVSGEVTYEVPPLAVPSAGVPGIERYDAVRLLVERGRAADPRFELTPANASAVARICRRLDGMPLALELAAARLRAFDVEELATALGDRFSVLRSGARTTPERHHTLQAAVDWSHDLLSSAEQTLFRRLSVFHGGFDLEAAQHVCAADPLSPREILTLLPELVDRSLVVADRRASGASRYRLLETLREYGLLQLDAAGEGEAIRRRHAEMFLAVAVEAGQRVHGTSELAALERIKQALDDVRAGMAWYLERGETGPVLHAAAVLWEYYQRHGNLADGYRWLTQALSADRGGNTSHRRAALAAAGTLACSQGEYEAAMVHAEECLRLSQEARDEYGAARSIHIMGRVALNRSDWERTVSLLADAISRYRKLGRRIEASWALDHLGIVTQMRGDRKRARALHEESLALARELGDRLRIAGSLWMLAVVELNDGQHDSARARCQESAAIFEELGNEAELAHVRHTLGDVARYEGDLVAAADLYHRNLAPFRRRGDHDCVASTLRNLGVVALEQSQTGEALRALAESLKIRHRLGDHAGVAECLDGMARAATALDQTERAVRLFAAAEVLHEASGAAQPAVEQARHARDVAATRAALGRDVFDAAWKAGGAMTTGQAVSEALALPDLWRTTVGSHGSQAGSLGSQARSRSNELEALARGDGTA